MGYIDKNLLPGENVIYRARVSWAAFIFPIIYLVFIVWLSTKTFEIITFFAVVFSIFILLRIWLAIVTTEFALTDRRIIAKRGFLRQHSMEILLSKIESVTISQPLGGRIFGYGTVTVVGSGGTQEYFKSIKNPLELRMQVNDQISRLEA